VLLHVGATLLLLGMLCALTGEPAPSAFVAGAFALHPLRAESVAWVSERKDVLAAVLWMSTMWLVHSNLGFLLAAQGNLDEAVDHYAAALREDPNLAPAHNNLGLALESLGRRDEALGHYSRAVELAPADLQNRLNYARALARSGRRGDAIGELREGLRRQPDWPPAEQDLIRLLAADADPARRTEAVALAETLVRRTTAPDAELLSTLAVAYEGAARFADALGVWRDAITAARAGGRTDLLPGLEAAVAACRARSPVTGAP